jgi:serine/threonine-protein kinase RsbW
VQATINNELVLSLPIDATSLADPRWLVAKFLKSAGVAPGMIDDILIALHEALANALRHSGSREDVAITVKAEAARVVVEVRDEGVGFDPRVVIPPRPAGLAAEGGRGLFIIWSLMSSVRLAHHSGTHLVMIKELFPR